MRFRPLLALLLVACSSVVASAQDKPKHLVLIAGRPSHPPRMHEFNAGVQLLTQSLKDVKGLKTDFVLNGWPEDEKLFDTADAVIFYMDGGPNHEIVKGDGTGGGKDQEGGKKVVGHRLKLVDDLTKRGVGIGCMHYGVEIVADQAGSQFKKWIGGHYEHMFSCNPIWAPNFVEFPDHPVARGVKPFQAKDEWYIHMRFVGDVHGDEAATEDGAKFQPILVGTPSDAVRDGPYVYPAGPYPHIQAEKGRAEAMMWVVERPDGGRGMGFTGGHFHDNWSDDNFRKVVLNSFLWLAKMEVPEGGVESKITKEDLDANLDPKPQKK